MDYSLVYVSLRNYRNHEKLDLQFNGKSYVLVADSGSGKTSILEAIKAAHKFTPFPSDALKSGTQDGSLEVGLEIKGQFYRILRDFDEKGQGRWRVRGENNSSYGLEDVLKQLFVGLVSKGLNGYYFDYAQYFYECKSPDARFKYLMECILGEAYDISQRKIKDLELERGSYGTKKKMLEAQLADSEITAENFDDLVAFYAEEQTDEKALRQRGKDLEQRVNLEEKNVAIQQVKDQLDEKLALDQSMLAAQQEIISMEEAIKKLKADIKNKEDALNKYKKERAKLPENLTERLTTLEKELQESVHTNREIEEKADLQYRNAVADIQRFNVSRQAFLAKKDSFLQLQEVDASWKKTDAEIKNIRAQNEGAVKGKLNVPALEIREITKEGRNGTIIEQQVFYKDRELNIESVSKGESIRIATQIQEALNPSGFRLILLPEAQSMGSSLKEIIQEAHAQGYQIIAEFTEPQRQLEAVIVEEFLEEKEAEQQAIADLRQNRRSAQSVPEEDSPKKKNGKNK